MRWIADANDPRVQEALGWSCDLCGAASGVLCVKREGFTGDLAARVIHFGRLVDRRKGSGK